MAETQSLQGHGEVSRRATPFTRLVRPKGLELDDGKLVALAQSMIIDDTETNDGRDSEENLFMPAGYTYFSQFVDHDLTLETTSSLELKNSPDPTNLRTPRLDLDCLYGTGPEDQPYMYAADGAKLLPDDPAAVDLVRIPSGNPDHGRAVIGDKRNDENSIVCQIQLAFIKFHNKVVDAYAAKGLKGRALFEASRNEVRWTYQRIVLEDLLARLVETSTYDFFTQQRNELGEGAYLLYTQDLRWALPLEFIGAAYRMGHSMVRTSYRLNRETKKPIFDGTDGSTDSLVGFQPLPTQAGKSHVIDTWARFFPPGDSLLPGMHEKKNSTPTEENNPAPRLQYAYKLDPSLVLPLANLPPSIGPGSLAALNLRRGNLFRLPSGQTVADMLGVTPLPPEYLVTRQKTEDGCTFAPIDEDLAARTPLWFYILAEAQVPTVQLWMEKKRSDLVDDDFFEGPASCSQLGPVGGRILMEVFNGLVDADAESFRYAKDWKPLVGDKPTMTRLLSFTGLSMAM